MIKLITIMAAGCFALGTAFAGEHGDAVTKIQNNEKGFRMACTIPTLPLQLSADQKEKWAAAMSEHHKAGCTPESEATLLAKAKEILTPEQLAKFKEKYESGPKMDM
jgi:hypothetical protein